MISRSGTLAYKVVDQLTKNGIGQSTCLGLGGDPVVGLSFVDVLKMSREDPATEAVVLIGEIGGSAEEQAAEYIRMNSINRSQLILPEDWPLLAKGWGTRGAIISGGSGTAQGKIQALQDAGVAVIETSLR